MFLVAAMYIYLYSKESKSNPGVNNVFSLKLEPLKYVK